MSITSLSIHNLPSLIVFICFVWQSFMNPFRKNFFKIMVSFTRLVQLLPSHLNNSFAEYINHESWSSSQSLCIWFPCVPAFGVWREFRGILHLAFSVFEVFFMFKLFHCHRAIFYSVAFVINLFGTWLVSQSQNIIF